MMCRLLVPVLVLLLFPLAAAAAPAPTPSVEPGCAAAFEDLATMVPKLAQPTVSTATLQGVIVATNQVRSACVDNLERFPHQGQILSYAQMYRIEAERLLANQEAERMRRATPAT